MINTKLSKYEKKKALILGAISIFILLIRFMPFGLAFTGLGTLFLVSSAYFFDKKKDFSFSTIFSSALSLFVLIMIFLKYRQELLSTPLE